MTSLIAPVTYPAAKPPTLPRVLIKRDADGGRSTREELGGHGPEVGQCGEDGARRHGDHGDRRRRRTHEQRDRHAHAADEGWCGDVPGAQAALGGVPRPEVKDHGRRQIRDRGDEALLEDVELGAELLLEPGDDGRQEERQRVQAVDEAEVDDGKHPDAPAADRRHEVAPAAVVGLLLRFALRLAGQPFGLLSGEPLGLLRGVGEVEPRDDADQDRGNRHAQEHEAPTLEPEDAVVPDQPAGQRRTDHGGQRLCEVEQREDLAAVARRHPQAEEQDGSWEEAGFGDAEQDPQRIQARDVLHEGEQQRHDAPRHHDSCQPPAGAELVERHVARDLQQDVAGEEDARREPELGCRQPEVLVHAVRSGEGDRGPVQIVDEEHHGDERNEPQRDLPDRRTLHRRRRQWRAHTDSLTRRFVVVTPRCSECRDVRHSATATNSSDERSCSGRVRRKLPRIRRKTR